MSIFITGGTGYLGSYVVTDILRNRKDRMTLLVRASNRQQSHAKLWKGLQMHMDSEEFYSHLSRIDFAYGDLHEPQLGFTDKTFDRVTSECDSVLHIAASLNRKSEKACLNSNLRGTLSVVKVAQAMRERSALRRFSHVSTVAVAGQRDREVVYEDTAIEWDRRDYDPYARTKKFCEHMVRELLPETQLTFFRPSIVMGDAKKAETTQFDMVRSFCVLADLPFLPLRPETRLDIVNADWVGHAIAHIHTMKDPSFQIYHLSAGKDAPTAAEITHRMADDLGRRRPKFIPGAEASFERLIDTMNGVKKRNMVSAIGALLKVFWPYISYDTVFDNTRAIADTGERPTVFTEYAADLYRFAKQVKYQYPYRELEPQLTVTPGATQISA